jgi:hypothetical protein
MLDEREYEDEAESVSTTDDEFHLECRCGYRWDESEVVGHPETFELMGVELVRCPACDG